MDLTLKLFGRGKYKNDTTVQRIAHFPLTASLLQLFKMDLNSLKDQVSNLTLYDLKAGVRKVQNGKMDRGTRLG